MRNSEEKGQVLSEACKEGSSDKHLPAAALALHVLLTTGRDAVDTEGRPWKEFESHAQEPGSRYFVDMTTRESRWRKPYGLRYKGRGNKQGNKYSPSKWLFGVTFWQLLCYLCSTSQQQQKTQ